MKAVIKLISGILILHLLTFASFAENQSISWYCIRNKEHNQPLIGKELLFCEKYDLSWCDKKYNSIDGEEKVIYLTFDAGYENGNIDKILEILNEEKVTGAFFILDNLIYKNKDLVQKMIENGHTIGNHTLKHKDMTKIKNKEEFLEELKSLEELYYQTFGVEMDKFYRPPEGKLNEANLKWATEAGYKTVMWSFAYADWDNEKQPSIEYAKRKILENIHNGEVMLLHPTSSTNVNILKDVIIELKNQGFRFGTLSELCNIEK